MDKAGSSFREIAAMLTACGARPKRGKAWYASSVRAMLRSRIAVESAAASTPAVYTAKRLARSRGVSPLSNRWLRLLARALYRRERGQQFRSLA